MYGIPYLSRHPDVSRPADTDAPVLLQLVHPLVLMLLRNKWLWLGSGMLVLLLLPRVISIVLLLFLANAAVGLFIRFMPLCRVFGSLELVLFCTVPLALTFGTKMGMFAALLCGATHFLCAGRTHPFHFLFVVPLYVGLGGLAPFFAPLGIATAGILLTISYNIVNTLLILTIYRGTIMNALLFVAINITHNVFLFTVLGPAVMGVLAS